MIMVSVKELVSAIDEVDAFKFPGMSAGADYLYNSLYKCLSKGNDVRLSEIDYERFELDDVDVIRSIYSGIIEPNESKADALIRTLQGISPAVNEKAFI